MKKINPLFILLGLLTMFACEPQSDSIAPIGAGPSNASLSVDSSDPYNPVFHADADNAFIFHWDLGPAGIKAGKTATAYFPIAGDYDVKAIIAGEGGQRIEETITYSLATTDPNVASLPVWNELTGGGAGRTWVYNTDVATGSPDYCYQTPGKEDAYYNPDYSFTESWGQCVQITDDINGAMTFDLNGGVNYTYHQVAGDAGVQGSFVLDTEAMTLTITDPYILDYNVVCTNPDVTMHGVYEIKVITDDELVLWQDQEDKSETNPWSTGWTWKFKRQ